MEKNSRHFWIRPARLQDRSSNVSPLKHRYLSISWDLMDGTFPQARHNSRNHSTSRLSLPWHGWYGWESWRCGEMMSPYPAVMKHDFESLYFLILQISNDGCPSNIQQQLLGYSRDEYLSLYSWVGSDHSFYSNHFLELPCMVTQHCGPHFWTCHLLNEWQDLDAPNIQCRKSC